MIDSDRREPLRTRTPAAGLVSVVIPTRDRPALLRQALDSVKAQEPSIPLQIIVADNAAQPAVAAIAQDYGAEYLATAAVGPGAVRNAGLKLARGEYVAFLDDDDAWTPDHLSSHLSLLENDPGLGATVSRMMIGDAGARPNGGKPIPDRDPGDVDMFSLFLSYFPSVCAVVARSSAVAALGGFDERLIHAEDFDWNLRLALANRVGFVTRTTFVVRWRSPQSQHDCQLCWIRLGYVQRVFWTNVLRAGSRRPRLRELLGTYRRQTGMFAIWLCACAARHLESGDRAGFLLRLSQAFVASPPHTLAWLARRWLRRGHHLDHSM